MSPTNSISVIAQLAKQAAYKAGIDSTVLGAGVGSLVGGLGGLALNPGIDEQGNKRSRLRKALLGALSGAGLGGAVGYSLNKSQDTDKDLTKVNPVSGLEIQEIPKFEPGAEDLSLVDPVSGIAKRFNTLSKVWTKFDPLYAMDGVQNHIRRINHLELNTHPALHLSRRLHAINEKTRRSGDPQNYDFGAAIYGIRDLLRREGLDGFRDYRGRFYPRPTGSYPREKFYSPYHDGLSFDLELPAIKPEYRDPKWMATNYAEFLRASLIDAIRWEGIPVKSDIGLLDPRHPGKATLPDPPAW
jgi:hypothetical protein